MPGCGGKTASGHFFAFLFLKNGVRCGGLFKNHVWRDFNNAVRHSRKHLKSAHGKEGRERHNGRGSEGCEGRVYLFFFIFNPSSIWKTPVPYAGMGYWEKIDLWVSGGMGRLPGSAGISRKGKSSKQAERCTLCTFHPVPSMGDMAEGKRSVKGKPAVPGAPLTPHTDSRKR